MNARLPLLPLLVLLLAGAALVADLPTGGRIDPQVLRANNQRWQRLPEAERVALRERWREYSRLPSGERETLFQRAETLRRLKAGLQQRTGREPSAEEAAGELAWVMDRARQAARAGRLAAGPNPTDADVGAALERELLRHVNAFMDSLARRGDIEPQALARLRDRPQSEQLHDALLRLKSEQLDMYAEGAPAAVHDELMALPPLDMAALAERRRLQDGFLGLLGRELQLTEAERRELRDAETWAELLEDLRDRKAPQIRGLLEARGVPAEHIDALLKGPICEMERDVHRLLRARRSSAADGGGGGAAPPVDEQAVPR
jgi:hypothetical protein